MKQIFSFVVIPLSISCVMSWGCRRQADPAKIMDAESYYAEAKECFEQGDYASAADKYGAAIAAGGLFADLYAIAQVRRAESLARVDRWDEALEILSREETGSPNLAEIHQIRAYIFTKQKRSSEAASEFQKARGYDPQIEKLKD